jgi:hypothetical protein
MFPYRLREIWACGRQAPDDPRADPGISDRVRGTAGNPPDLSGDGRRLLCPRRPRSLIETSRTDHRRHWTVRPGEHRAGPSRVPRPPDIAMYLLPVDLSIGGGSSCSRSSTVTLHRVARPGRRPCVALLRLYAHLVDLSTIISLSALAVAIASATFTALAAKRATVSLRLQRSIDARSREFREVSWDASILRQQRLPDKWVFELRHTGLTVAKDVTLVVDLDELVKFDLGDVAPGESRIVEPPSASVWYQRNQQSAPLHPGFRVHWSSPEGFPSERLYPPNQLFP